jgi:hypothetical protein
MCLYSNEKGTKRFKERLDRNDGYVTCYKVYTADKQKKILSSIFSPNLKGGIIKGYGNVISTRKKASMTAVEKKIETVNKGIHVYSTKEAAQSQVQYNYKAVVVPVKCRKQHFVAASHPSDSYWLEAVFTQVEITKRNWDRIMGDK